MTEAFLTVGAGVLGLSVIGLVGGALLQYASKAFKVEGSPLVDSIDALLPQTQCGQCGHPGCKPYAEAIANGELINRCPPGGQETVDRLATLLGVDSRPLDAVETAERTGENLEILKNVQRLEFESLIESFLV